MGLGAGGRRPTSDVSFYLSRTKNHSHQHMARSGGMMKFPDPAILVTIFFKKYEIPTYLRFLGLLYIENSLSVEDANTAGLFFLFIPK